MTLETDLRDAIDRGDETTIDALGAQLDTQPAKPAATLHSAALYYASIGLHVFPLTPGTKIPMKGSGGCLDATTDTDTINRWWTGNPKANIGIATGHLVDVVDIDGHKGQRSRVEHWDDVFAKIDADNVGKVLTPRQGGLHVYVPATGEGNGTNIVPAVDYRGLGGYVVAPPSVTADGSYRWLGTPTIPTLSDEATE